MLKPVVKIKNWSIDNGQLHGEVIDHPRFQEGERVSTSTIIKRHMNPSHGATIETKNTIYVLIGKGEKQQ